MLSRMANDVDDTSRTAVTQSGRVAARCNAMNPPSECPTTSTRS